MCHTLTYYSKHSQSVLLSDTIVCLYTVGLCVHVKIESSVSFAFQQLKHTGHQQQIPLLFAH